MTTIATSDGYSTPLLAYAPPADTKAEARRLRLVLVIVLMWAILKVAGRVIGWIHWGFPDSSQWLSMTPARVIERSFMFFLLPLFNLVLTVVAIRGLRRGKLSDLDKAAVWAGVILYLIFMGVLTWLVVVTWASMPIKIMMFVGSRPAIDMLPLLLLLGFSGWQRQREIHWHTWGPAIGCTALLLASVFVYWLTSFQDAQRELMFDLFGRSWSGNLGAIRAVGQLAVYAGLAGFVATGLIALVYRRGAQAWARVCTTLLLAGLAVRAGETIYVYGVGSFSNAWDRYSRIGDYAGLYGGLTLLSVSGGGFTGRDLAFAWGAMLSNSFILFAFAFLCRMAVAGPEHSRKRSS